MKIIAPILVTDTVLISSNVAETDYAVYSPSATYGLNQYVIVTTGVHKIYQSMQANNVGHAVTDTAWWLDCGPTNKWKMYDQSVQSQTVNATSITNTYQISGRCNAVAAFNLDAASIRVQMIDTVSNQPVYDKTLQLISYVGRNFWASYFRNPIVRLRDVVFADLPSFANAQINVTIAAPSGNAACGALILGNCSDVGGTTYGMKLGTTSYSVKTQDQFGNYTITKRAFRKTGEFTVQVASSYVDQLYQLLTAYRDTPVVYIGTGIYQADMIYGFYKDFSITVAYESMSLCAITIEGLT